MAKLALVLVGIFLAATTTKCFVSGAAIIESSLQQRFLTGQRENVMVSFTQGIQPLLDQVNRMNFSSQAEKRTFLTNAQQTFANGVQGTLQNFLSTQGVPFETFWINNKMIIPNAAPALVRAVSMIPGVSKVEKEPVINLEPIGASNITQSRASLSWGIQKIRADQVWSSYKGKNIVVANIDTGVRYTHETLRGRWRTSYGWFDPYSKTSTPNDQNGHGTHTMGTIAGSNGIGVAPEATWIACKGCSTSSCGGSQLFSCGQWIQCPSRPDGTGKDCTKAPKVVSNSWGGPGGNNWYDDVIKSWHTASIIPVFSIGNSGRDGCGSAGSPGDNVDVIGVGSTDSNERISYFSSLGPTQDGRTKPEIVAPGGQIRSAWYTSDTAYNTISGTSMSCPHVAGVVALMKQKNPSMNYNTAKEAITDTAVTSSLDTSTAKTCGGSTNSYPNNVFGYGRIDALNSVNAV